MATLNEYRSKFRLLSKQEVIAERREPFETMNGNAFFPLKSWPQEYQRMFWAKPHGDKETFKLMMFCLGNGCAPQLITHWIILSQSWLSLQNSSTCVLIMSAVFPKLILLYARNSSSQTFLPGRRV